MAYVDYWSELKGHIPELPPLLAQKLINRAYRDIKDSRVWSWLTQDGVLNAPQQISTGTVTVTQFSNVVTMDAAAFAVLNGLSNPMITARQFRVSSSGPPPNPAILQNSVGSIYSIVAFDEAHMTFTLDRIYYEASQSGSSYQVYQCYFAPPMVTLPGINGGNPVVDFLRWIDVTNPIDGYRFRRRNLHRTKQDFDRIDPTRGSQGLGYCLGDFKSDPTGIPIYEMWPHPVEARAYVCLFQRRGQDMTAPTDDIPVTLSKDMLVERALYYGCEWAAKNSTRYPALKDVSWVYLMNLHQKNYDNMLTDAHRQDEEMMRKMVINFECNYGYLGPIDSDYFQSHDLPAVAGY